MTNSNPILDEAISKWREEMYLAFKRALEEQRTVDPCEDAISREATVEQLCKVAEFMNEKRDGLGSPYVMAALFIQDNKEEFPSVTPKQRTGHWILDETDNSITCDKCGCIIWANDISNGEAYYCPNCGAKMVEPQERSDKE